MSCDVIIGYMIEGIGLLCFIRLSLQLKVFIPISCQTVTLHIPSSKDIPVFKKKKKKHPGYLIVLWRSK